MKKSSITQSLITLIISLFILISAAHADFLDPRLTPVPTGIENYYGVWGSSASDVFVVGDIGIIMHYDGSTWQRMESGTDAAIYKVWGPAQNSPATDVFAVGEYGTILHYDGTRWTPMESGTDVLCRDIWGSSGSDVFAVGDNGTILHYNGKVWKPMNTKTEWRISGIWGNSGTDVFAVTMNDNTILHYDGTGWAEMYKDETMYFRHIWGSSGTDVFAAGTRGVVHYDGRKWTRMDNSGEYPSYIWGSSGKNVITVGLYGIMHYDGTAWSAAEISADCELRAVWGSSASDVYAVGVSGIILHYDGTAWSALTDCLYASALVEIWARSVSDVFAGSFVSGTILHYDGAAWTGTDSGADQVTGIWGSSASVDTFAVGYAGGALSVLHYDGLSWNFTDYDMGGDYGLNSPIWGSSASDVFVLSSAGLAHYDGSTWEMMETGSGKNLSDIWGSSASDVFAVGDSGTILHYDGMTWTAMDSGTDNSLYEIWGSSEDDVFAAGESGTILHYDGLTWSPMESGTDMLLAYGMWGSSGSDVFVAGRSNSANISFVLHYDGKEWRTVLEGRELYIYDIWTPPSDGEPGSDMFIAADGPRRYHYDSVSVLLPESVREGDEIRRGEVRVENAPANDLTISLTCGNPSEITVPQTVIIPAGETSAGFDMVIADDTLADGAQKADIFASAAGYFSSRGSVRVSDNEAAVIMLNLPSEVREGDGRITGEITICEDRGESPVTECSPLTAGRDVIVSLYSDDITEITVPIRVIIPAGSSGTSFDMRISDDRETDDTQKAGITARVDGWTSGTAAVSVADNDRYVISLTLPEKMTEGDEPRTGTVSLSEAWSEDVIVKLSSGDPSELAVPPAVTVPAGIRAADFELTVMEDALPDGDQKVIVTASAPDWASGMTAVTVRDADAREIIIYTRRYFQHIWGSSENNVFAVGDNGLILHYDGTAWTETDSGTGNDLYAVWGSSENDVFAAGGNGIILHYDGTAWTETDIGRDNDLNAVWGSSGNDVFAAGENGIILHYDGTAWTETDSGTDKDLYAVWGSSAGNVFAVGAGGIILHYDGAAWSKTDSGSRNHLGSVWGTSADNVFVVGTDIILHYDGLTWSPMESGTGSGAYEEPLYLNSVWGSSADNIFAVGSKILHYDGTAWTETDSGTGNRYLYAVWGSAADNVYAAAISGILLHYDGTAWNKSENPGSEDIRLNDVWYEPSETNGRPGAYAVGNSGIILHYDGESWQKEALGTDWQMRLNGVWGAAAGQNAGSEIFAVGELGTVLYYDGNNWRKMEIVTDRQLNDVWGSSVSDVYAVGDGGTVLHYDGSQWTPMESNTVKKLRAVWVSPPDILPGAGSASEVFAAGDDGIIIRYDGSEWHPMESGTNIRIYNLKGTSASDVFASGDSSLLQYDGTQWKTVMDSYNNKGIIGNSRGDTILKIKNEYKIVHRSAFLVKIPQSISEGAGVSEGLVSIPFILENDLNVKLTSLNPSEVTVPENLIIPAGETSAAFVLTIKDDTLADSTQTVPILATAPGHKFLNGGRAEIRITDNETAVLSLSLPETADEGGQITGIVFMSEPAGKDIAVSIEETGFFKKIRFLTVTIPQGQTSAEFTVTLDDDTEIGGSKSVNISASVENWTSGTAAVSVTDNEIRELALSIPETTLETDGVITGTVSIPGTLAKDLTISLLSSDTSEIIVPKSIIIYAGDMSASFDFILIDDFEIDGTQSVTLTASADKWTSGEAVILVNDNDPGILQFSSKRYTALRSQGKFPVTVNRKESSSGEVSVQLSVNNEQLSDGQTIVFGDGETEKTVFADFRNFENPENLSLILLNPLGGASLGTPAVADLIIADKIGWQQQEVPTRYHLRDVWGSGYADVFAVGWQGAILHYDGTEWSEMSNDAKSVFFEGVWGSSGSDVFAVGNNGIILHYDGMGWNSMESPTDKNLNAVCGNSGMNIFAAGSGIILHYDGTEWSKEYDSGSMDDINGLWVSAESEVFAVGYNGVILHYKGTEWEKQESGTSANLYAVWGSTGTDVFAAGASGVILHYDGSAWQEMNSNTENPVLFLEGVWGSDKSDVFAAGYNGALLHYNGKDWHEISSSTDNSFNSIWGSSGLDIFAVGDGGIILHYAPEEEE
ncbi:CalX-like domain-containing protein [Desulfonema limicola]|uniref:CalX-like domain-containing protein n=1 Tax=Desulfonema limicola TaxID=45656 RepID=A0A975GE66_9BACT|nr:hypothetical protein [Desulfonema limicola]QTA77907.1 CalX-like domain-containing protein [Desulfonema limicola]